MIEMAQRISLFSCFKLLVISDTEQINVIVVKGALYYFRNKVITILLTNHELAKLNSGKSFIIIYNHA